MSEKKTEAKPTAVQPPHIELKLDTIPVKVIKAGAREFDLPGKLIGSSITANPEKPTNQNYHSICFVPMLRAFCVSFHSASHGTIQYRYVMESAVSQWEPML